RRRGTFAEGDTQWPRHAPRTSAPGPPRSNPEHARSQAAGNTARAGEAQMSSYDVLLSAKDLSVRFGGVLAVNKVSFDVRRGEVFTLIGPNGAGKTTVFNLISRIYTPTTGEIVW